MTLDPKTLEAVAFAGEMLIRAGSALGGISKEQQISLADATQGALPNAIVEALDAAKAISESVAQSLRTHPPLGLPASPGY